MLAHIPFLSKQNETLFLLNFEFKGGASHDK
ncbi:hypothetical protein KKC_02389 [Listeria fleischmannii subsp. coloradonensis]|nr:hypothetical protein KKC_02389 [Listeria fleischmannii subsp. coloradonensis]